MNAPSRNISSNSWSGRSGITVASSEPRSTTLGVRTTSSIKRPKSSLNSSTCNIAYDICSFVIRVTGCLPLDELPITPAKTSIDFPSSPNTPMGTVLFTRLSVSGLTYKSSTSDSLGIMMSLVRGLGGTSSTNGYTPMSGSSSIFSRYLLS